MPGKLWNAKRGGIFLRLLFCVCAGLLWLCASASLKADTLILNSGEVLEGQILSETETQIEIMASYHHGTILAKRDVPKADIKSIVRESVEQKQEKADFAALGKYTLTPNQELTTDQYATGIAAFKKFLATYPNSSNASDVTQRVTDWRAEASNAASGKVKFNSLWMTPEEKKPRAARWQKQADAEAAQNALQLLQKQLADLQAQRETVAKSIAAAQAKLAAAQARLTTGSGGGVGASSGGRRDLAGKLTAGVVANSQQGAGREPVSDSENSRLQGEIASYQQQISQEQGALASVDAKIAAIQSQLPQREVDLKLAMFRLSETSAQGTTGAVHNASAKGEAKKKQPSTPKPEPPPPWYTRAWKWLHG
jgi:chromosome segregation ATPase